MLAGRKVNPSRLAQFPEAVRSILRPAEPDDLVVLSFSSHGVTEANEFYLLPYDLGRGSGGKQTPELLKRAISSQELSTWLGPMDAEMFLIVDSCHSAASVEQEGFKPGPMGNAGLGQLSYDKRMLILAASQAADGAYAEGYSLLTEAFAKGGLEKTKTLKEAMRYAEQKELGWKGEKIQQPKLFEFGR